MSDSTEETIKQNNEVLQAIAELSKRFDSFESNTNTQFEAIRTDIIAKSADFDRLTARVLNLSADVKDLTEEVRQNQKILSLK